MTKLKKEKLKELQLTESKMKKVKGGFPKIKINPIPPKKGG